MSGAVSRASSGDQEFRSRIRPEALTARILIADDEPLNLMLISTYLRQMGFTNLEVATDGVAALAQTRASRPDLLILDIMMPGMSGHDVCRSLRADPEFADLPILVQTALRKAEDRIEIFRAGATDLVVKPINRLEMVARVAVHLERRLLIQSLRQTGERIDRELQAARDMQIALMPSDQEIRQLTGCRLEVAATYLPSSELGGDFWGLVSAADGRHGFYIADFAGHGVLSALNTVRLHTLVSQIAAPLRDPADFLRTINAGLTGLLPTGQFATATCVLIDPVHGTLSYAAAGAPPPLLHHLNGPWELLDSAGVPLGITRATDYHSRTIAFPPGSTLFLYSDAFSETVLATGERLEEAGVRDLASGIPTTDADGFLTALTARFRHRLAAPPIDDLTAIAIRHCG